MQPRYVIVTPARNEEAFIELTLKSVVKQTIRPLRWIVVSDGSTDRTDEIVGRYASQHEWIKLLRAPERKDRHFGGKAVCVNLGAEQMKDLDFDVIVSMDADLSFSEDYFQFLLGKLAGDSRLGLVGTPYCEDGRTYDYRFSSLDHVSGACQVFRRECFEAIGGYVPVRGGGIDVIAVTTARMKGWLTRTFPEKTCAHHRPMGSAVYGGRIKSEFRLGQRQYCLGFHPLWQVCRSLYQMTRMPYIVGGSALFCGYFHAMLARKEHSVSRELIQFQRRDQMRRLRNFLGLGPRQELASNERAQR
jgi:poly-beta-1,6-N-acetyl-D-glucosamine synthase